MFSVNKKNIGDNIVLIMSRLNKISIIYSSRLLMRLIETVSTCKFKKMQSALCKKSLYYSILGVRSKKKSLTCLVDTVYIANFHKFADTLAIVALLIYM